MDFALTALSHIKAADTKYLLVTNYPRTTENVDVPFGSFYRNSMALPPFGFPAPLENVNQLEGDPDHPGFAEMTLCDIQAWLPYSATHFSMKQICGPRRLSFTRVSSRSGSPSFNSTQCSQ